MYCEHSLEQREDTRSHEADLGVEAKTMRARGERPRWEFCRDLHRATTLEHFRGEIAQASVIESPHGRCVTRRAIVGTVLSCTCR